MPLFSETSAIMMIDGSDICDHLSSVLKFKICLLLKDLSGNMQDIFNLITFVDLLSASSNPLNGTG